LADRQTRARAQLGKDLRPQPGVVADRREDALYDRLGADRRARLRVELRSRRQLEPGLDLLGEPRPGRAFGTRRRYSRTSGRRPAFQSSMNSLSRRSVLNIRTRTAP
jgi:hypothetical protein